MVTARLLVAALALGALACASPTGGPEHGAPRKFVVMLEGRNLLLDYHGKPVRFGFSTTRNVVAATPEEAEQIAIREVREDESLARTLKNAPDDPPHYTATHHIEVDSFDSVAEPDLGYIFYRDRDTH